MHLRAVDIDLHGRQTFRIGVVHEHLDVSPGVVLQFLAGKRLPIVFARGRIVHIHAQDRVGRFAGLRIDLVHEVDGRLDVFLRIEVARVGRRIGADEIQVGVHERLELGTHLVGRHDAPRQVVALRVELEVDAVGHLGHRAGHEVRDEAVRDVRLVAVDHRPDAGGVGLHGAVRHVCLVVRERAELAGDQAREPGLEGVGLEAHVPPVVGCHGASCRQPEGRQRDKRQCFEFVHVFVLRSEGCVGLRPTFGGHTAPLGVPRVRILSHPCPRVKREIPRAPARSRRRGGNRAFPPAPSAAVGGCVAGCGAPRHARVLRRGR